MNIFECKDIDSGLIYWQEDDIFLVTDDISFREIGRIGNLIILNNPQTLQDIVTFVHNNAEVTTKKLFLAHYKNGVLDVDNTSDLYVYYLDTNLNVWFDLKDKSNSYIFDKNSKLAISNHTIDTSIPNPTQVLLLSIQSESPKHSSNPAQLRPQFAENKLSVRLLEKQSRKFLTIVLLFLLISIVIWSLFLKRPARLQKSREELIQVFLTTQKGKIISNIVTTGIPTLDPDAQKDITEAVNTFIKIHSLSSEAETDLRKKIDQMISESLGISNIDLQKHFDLSSISLSAHGDLLAKSGEDLLVLDKSFKKLYLISKKKSTKIISNDLLENTLSIYSYGGRVVGLTKNNEIWHLVGGEIKLLYDTTNLSEIEYLPLIGLFGEKIYLVQKVGGIDKFEQIDGVASKTAYLTSDALIPSQEAVSMGIDGYLYLATKSNMFRLVRGVVEKDFYLNLNKEDKIHKIMVPSLKEKPIYVWIKNRGKIIGFEKNGKFKSQSSSKYFEDAQDVFFDDISGNLFVLSDNVIYLVHLL